MSRKKDHIKISFVDSMSAIDVTGSNILVETPNYKILLDCGMHQSNNKKEDFLINNRKPKEFKPKDIDFVFITHSHIDHMALLPKLYKDGFRGATIMPIGQKSIYEMMAKDCAYINERDILIINKQNGTNYLPLYTEENVYKSLDYIFEKPIGEKIVINDEISFMFVPSGHLLHGCQILLWITYNNITKCIAYTGDIGNPNIKNKYVGSLEKIKNCDILIGESTYGDREKLNIGKKERQNDIDKIRTIIDTQVIQMKGKLVIPTFAQSRSAQLINIIYNLYKDSNFQYKIYLDSPLAVNLFKDLINHLQDEELEEFKKILEWDKLVLVKNPEDSKQLVSSKEPCVIISTSGMCTVGRIRHHFKSIVSDPNATILFCGYSSPNTLASTLKDPKTKEIDIDGKSYKVKCSVYNLKSMSGHAMFNTLVDYYSNVNCNKIILHHGSEESKSKLSKKLKEELEKKCKSTRVICANNSLKITL